MNGCPMCGHDTATVLGPMGQLVWVRCRACGIDYAINEEEVAHAND